jgi:mono/diheme cytochrome c family protein
MNPHIHQSNPAHVSHRLNRKLHATSSSVKAFSELAALLALIGFPFCSLNAASLPPAATQKVDFSRDIEPIFKATCYECHGEKKQKGGLRLDQRALALKGGDSGPLWVAGKSPESLLILAVAGAKPDLDRMPYKKEPLTSAQISLLRAWIDQGSNWPESTTVASKDWHNHWAFKSPVRPAVPNPPNSRWIRNPVDAFVLDRLDKEKLKPSPETDKITLLRRLSLDLIGLPPTIAETDAFLSDHSKYAYEKQVERLLASPHYGERWGRVWLDAARYADSDGFEKDKSRDVWFYRDWVINALNRDMPYDQFIIDQIAGDQLPNATQDQVVATGFLRNSMINAEGGVDPEQFRMDAMFDRMDCIGKSILGLTIQCAQCHNHKFDPLTQQEYYRLFAFINNDHEEQRVVYTPDEQMLVANLSRQIKDLEAGMRHAMPDWEQKMAAWEDSVRNNQPEWTVLHPTVEDISTGGQRYLPQSDGSFLALGYAPTKHTVKLFATNDVQYITAFRLELLNDPNLPCHGPGRSYVGTCALTEFKVEALDAANPTNKTTVKFSGASSDFDPPEEPLESHYDDKSGKRRVTGPIQYAIDDKDDTAWGIDAGPGRRNQERKAVFQCQTNVGFSGGTILVFNLAQNHGGWNSDDHMNNNLGRFRLSLTTNAGPITADPIPARVRELIQEGVGTATSPKLIQKGVGTASSPTVPRDHRSPNQIAAIFSYWRTLVPEFKEGNQKIEALWKQWPAGTTTLTLLSRNRERETHILKRGDWLKPTDSVTAGVPAFLHPLATASSSTNFPEREGVHPLSSGPVRLGRGEGRGEEANPSSIASPTISNSSPADSRLALAHWLVDKRSPTTARVAVNRIWQTYFGSGLVSTPEDFGMQSQPPSHPELLDWLASELMEPGRGVQTFGNRPAAPPSPRGRGIKGEGEPTLPQGDYSAHGEGERIPWSLKHIHRLIVNSSTYRQSSKVSPELFTRDPANRLLARGPRLRLEAELVRDVALSASGLLNPKIGGPSIFSPSPAFLYQPPASYAPFPWKEVSGDDRYRRAIYTFRRRSTPYPMLQVFDAPNGDSSCVRRMRSNTPLQALVLLNETVFVECAQGLARKILADGGHTDGERLTYAFRQVLSRPPTHDEETELINLLHKQQQRIAAGWVNATEIGTGKSDPPEKLPNGTTPAQLAAYTVVSRVLLNLDEAITKE